MKMTSSEELLDDAISLLPVARSSDARRRTVASRLYYSAYHAALQLAQARSYASGRRPGSVHSNLRKFLAASGDPELAELAEFLRILFDRRLAADYELGGKIEYVDLEDSRELAKIVVSAAAENLGRL